MLSPITCPGCGNDDQDTFTTDVTRGRTVATFHGWICGKCGTKIPELWKEEEHHEQQPD